MGSVSDRGEEGPQAVYPLLRVERTTYMRDPESDSQALPLPSWVTLGQSPNLAVAYFLL